MLLGCVSAILVIPALIVLCTTKGFGHTFFKTPDTNTTTAFHKIKDELDNTVIRNLQKAQDMKAEVFALKPNDNHVPASDSDTSQTTPKNASL